MNDTVIKGTHNSRSILGSQDIPEDWAEARAQLVNTGWPIDQGPLNPLGCLQIGTGYTKAEVLPADLQAFLNLPNSATPADALVAAIAEAKGQAIAGRYFACGSYVGTGGTGADNPTKLSFPFNPKVLFVTYKAANKNYLYDWEFFVYPLDYCSIYAELAKVLRAYVTWGNNYVSWYVLDNASAQLNASGTTYHYFALG